MKQLPITLVLGMLASAQDPLMTGVTLGGPKNCPVFVVGVMAASPAARAGIRAGDKVLKVMASPLKILLGPCS